MILYGLLSVQKILILIQIMIGIGKLLNSKMEKLFGIGKLAVDEKTISHVLSKLVIRLPITFTFE